LAKQWVWNEEAVMHKLSHRELKVYFTLLEVEGDLSEHKDAVRWSELSSFAVPVLIANFINRFKF